MTEVVLHHFRSSPYNEKIRWALDFKGLACARKAYLPGPHLAQIKKLSGQTATPVLEIDGEVFIGSANILRVLEERFPAPQLFPDDAAVAQDIDEVEKRFDDDFVPRVRRALLNELLKTPQYIARVFVGGERNFVRRCYGLVLPLVGSKIRSGNGIAGAASVEDGNVATQEAFDFIAGRVNAHGYLFTDQFSAGDLAVAALMAPVVLFETGPMKRPMPMPKGFEAWMLRWHDHPGANWVREMYAKHREGQRT